MICVVDYSSMLSLSLPHIISILLHFLFGTDVINGEQLVAGQQWITWALGCDSQLWQRSLSFLCSSYLMFLMSPSCSGGRDSSVGIVTSYGLDGPGSNPGEGEISRTRPDWPWGPPSLLYNGYRVFTGGKAARAWPWPPTPIFSAEVLNWVEIYLYPP